MRGKKADPEFLSDFISQCVMQNKTSQDEIVAAAKKEIAAIDQKIIEAEKLKVTRSKLLDVITAFEKPNTSKKEEAKILPFFKLANPKICKFICDALRKETIMLDSLKKSNFVFSDIIFSIKQLQEHKIISRVGDYLIRGDRFEEYSKFVLCEV